MGFELGTDGPSVIVVGVDGSPTSLRAAPDAVIVGASTRIGHRLAGSLAVRLVRAGKWPVTVVP